MQAINEFHGPDILRSKTAAVAALSSAIRLCVPKTNDESQRQNTNTLYIKRVNTKETRVAVLSSATKGSPAKYVVIFWDKVLKIPAKSGREAKILDFVFEEKIPTNSFDQFCQTLSHFANPLDFCSLSLVLDKTFLSAPS